MKTDVVVLQYLEDVKQENWRTEEKGEGLGAGCYVRLGVHEKCIKLIKKRRKPYRFDR